MAQKLLKNAGEDRGGRGKRWRGREEERHAVTISNRSADVMKRTDHCSCQQRGLGFPPHYGGLILKVKQLACLQLLGSMRKEMGVIYPPRLKRFRHFRRASFHPRHTPEQSTSTDDSFALIPHLLRSFTYRIFLSALNRPTIPTGSELTETTFSQPSMCLHPKTQPMDSTNSTTAPPVNNNQRYSCCQCPTVIDGESRKCFICGHWLCSQCKGPW